MVSSVMSAFILLPFISVVLVHLTPFISTHNQTIAGQTHLIFSTQKDVDIAITSTYTAPQHCI
jgi:hypothetical protein